MLTAFSTPLRHLCVAEEKGKGLRQLWYVPCFLLVIDTRRGSQLTLDSFFHIPRVTGFASFIILVDVTLEWIPNKCANTGIYVSNEDWRLMLTGCQAYLDSPVHSSAALFQKVTGTGDNWQGILVREQNPNHSSSATRENLNPSIDEPLFRKRFIHERQNANLAVAQ